MNRLLPHLIFLMAALVFATVASAAAVWTQQPGLYFKYDDTPNNLTDSHYQHVISSDVEGVNTAWIKLNGSYIQCISDGGSKRYYPQGFDCTGKQIVLPPPPPPPPPPPVVDTGCEGAFVCHPEWGWIVDLTQLKADGCDHVKISNNQAMFYEGKRLENGQPVCKKWPQN